jgi:hypothetical protein
MHLFSSSKKSKFCSTGLSVAVSMAAACLVPQLSEAQGEPDRSGPGRDTGIALTLVGDATGPKYFAALRNSTAKPLFLVIGTITANDKWLCPSRIELLITGPDGKTHRSESSFGCNSSGAIGGRMDPLIIPLPAGAAYSLPVLDLRGAAAGRYVVKARYAGVPISLRSCNLDMQALSLVHYWTGTVESDRITVDVR